MMVKVAKWRKAAAAAAALAGFLAFSPAVADETIIADPFPSAEQERPASLAVRGQDATPSNEGDLSNIGESSSAMGRGIHDPNAVFEQRGAVYLASSLDEFWDAVERIASSDAEEATVQLSANLCEAQKKAGKPFVGVPGKTVMLSSVDGAEHDVYLGSELVGGLVLDNVSTEIASNTIYANAHGFETTDRYSGAMSFLYGGGSAGNDVKGDCSIVLRGGYVAQLYGGGRDSNVDGNVRIIIDAPTTPGTLPVSQSVNNFHGGGHALKTDRGRISGDVTIDFRSGSNAAFFGGGNNEFDRDASHVSNPAAMVSGTVTVNLGYEGASLRSVWPGLAMYTYAGSEYSTVGNICLNVLDGCTDNGDRNFYGCGYNDTVLGTVKVVVEGAVDLSSGFIHYGGDTDKGYYVDGNVNILNQGRERDAVSVRWNVPADSFEGYAWTGVQANEEDVPLTIEGDALVNIESGYLAFAKLDSENSSAVINGDSRIRVSGDAKIAQIEGNMGEYKSEGETHRTVFELDDVNATIGYCYLLDEVHVANGSTALIDGGTDVFPMFGEATQKPFYSVNDLVVDGESSLTTRNSDTQVRRNVVMDRGTWHAKGYTYVYEAMNTRESSILLDTYYQVGYSHRDDADPTLVTSWTSVDDTVVTGYSTYLDKVHGSVEATGGTWSLLSRTGVTGHFKVDGLSLQLPVVAEGANYPVKSIPLAIDGVSNGHADVVTVSRDGLSEGMDASTWNGRPVVPTLTENYITSWAPKGVGAGDDQNDPAQAVFTLAAGVQGEDDYFLKRLPDADGQHADSYYMWQVADGFAVTFDKNNDDEGSTDADPARMAISSNPGDAVALGKLPGEPTRPGYVFDGWHVDAEGTGERVDEGTMVDDDVTFYAKWSTAPVVGPDPQSHTVTFDDRMPDVQDRVDTVDHGKTVTRPIDPVCPGYEFGGWFVDEGCANPFDFSSPIIKDEVLYAKWTEKSSNPADPVPPAVSDGLGGSDNTGGISAGVSNPSQDAASRTMPATNDSLVSVACPLVALSIACVAALCVAALRLRFADRLR